jgi:hypothetical protein
MKVQLIGRENIFSTIKDIILLEDRVCHFIPVTGKGGSGKTMLFNQIQEYFKDHADEYPHVVVINYDYRDLRSQSFAGTLFMNVCKMLEHNKKLFPPKAVKLFFRMLLTAPEGLDGLLNFSIRQVENIIKSGVRLVLLEDTVETIYAPSEYINNIFKMGSFLPNCVAIVAGRPEDNTYQHLGVINTTLGKNDWVLHPPFELSSFTLEETRQFIQNHFGFTLPENLIKKIHLLTSGSPIHLAIVTEVLNSNASLAIFDEDLEVLKQKMDCDRAELLARFEHDLMAEISHLGSRIDWTILYLAYFNRRYDRKIIKLLMGGSDLEIEALENKYKNLLYLRKSSLPSRQSREMLHDEVQRMINTLVWERIDFMKSQRTAITHKVIDGYYKPEIKAYQEGLAGLNGKRLDLEALTQFMEDSFALAELQNECLDYYLRVDVPRALAYFDQLADEVNQSKYPKFNRMLLDDGIKNIGLSRYMPAGEIQARIYQR